MSYLKLETTQTKVNQMLIRWIRTQIHMMRSVRFTIKYSDAITNITRERTLEAATGEAVQTYMNEMYLLLPRRYKNILQVLHEKELLGDVAYQEYLEASTGTILSSEMHEFDTDTATGEFSHKVILRKDFPWKDNPSILKKLPESLVAKIRELEADVTKFKRDHNDFIHALQILPFKDDVSGKG